jgi:CTP:molybdopterin cytidylyltransferase MocA
MSHSETASKPLVAAVVLAAGASTRFGFPKQRILLDPVLDRVRASRVDRTVVVLGAHQVDTDAETVPCADWERGPGASLRCGLGALGRDIEAAVVVLADGPDLAPEAIDRVVAAWRESRVDVVAATYGGERGHPVLLARSVWSRIPDEGARGLEALVVPCDDLGAPGDVDVLSDLPCRFRAGADEVNRVDDDELRTSAPPDPPAEATGLAAPERPPAAQADPGGGGEAG